MPTRARRRLLRRLPAARGAEFTVRAARTRSACWRPPGGRPRRSRRSRSPTSSGSGSAICGDRRRRGAIGRAASGTSRSTTSEATVGADQLELERRRRGPLLPRADAFPNPNPAELELVAPARAQAGEPFTVSVIEHTCVTDRTPFDDHVHQRPGRRGDGQRRRRAGDHRRRRHARRSTVATAPATLTATAAGADIPSETLDDVRRRGRSTSCPADARRSDRRQPAGRPDQGHRGRRLDPRARRRRQDRRPQGGADRVNCGGGTRHGARVKRSRRRRPRSRRSCERIKRKR